MAHVGDEVPPDLLEPPPFGHVLDDGDHAERPPPVIDQPRPHGQSLARRSVEIERPLGRTVLPGIFEELGHRLSGQGIPVAVVHQGHRSRVAEGHLTVLVADDHPLRERVERPAQPDGVGAGFRDRFGSLAGHPLEVTEQRFDTVFIRWFDPQAVGKRGQALLQAAASGPATDPIGDGDADEGRDAQDDVPDDVRLHRLSMTGR